MRIETSALEVAQRYIGTREAQGIIDNPTIMAMLTLDAEWPEHDEVPWCSAFVNWVAWNLGLCRSGSLAARSWLNVGKHVERVDAEPGLDVVVLSRPPNPKSGHVGFFYDFRGGNVGLVGGNQGDAVNLVYFDTESIIGIRRLRRG